MKGTQLSPGQHRWLPPQPPVLAGHDVELPVQNSAVKSQVCGLSLRHNVPAGKYASPGQPPPAQNSAASHTPAAPRQTVPSVMRAHPGTSVSVPEAMLQLLPPHVYEVNDRVREPALVQVVP